MTILPRLPASGLPDRQAFLDQEAPPEHEASPSLFAVLDDRLHGRWVAAIVLGTIVGVLVAAAGYLKAPVRFSSTGTIHVAPRGLAVLRKTADTSSLPKAEYDSFVLTQAALLREQRVINRALDKPAVAALGVTITPGFADRLRKRLSVENRRGTELITASFEWGSPEAAATILNAILDSYEELHGNDPLARRQQRLNILRRERSELNAARGRRRQELQDYVEASYSGTSNPEPLRDMKVVAAEELRQELDRATLQSTLIDGAPNAENPTASIREPTSWDLALIDPSLTQLRLDRERQQLEVEQRAENLHDDHPILEDMRQQLRLIEALLARREAAAREKFLNSPERRDENGGIMSPRYRERLGALLDQTEDDVRELTREIGEINDLKDAIEQLETRLQEIDEAIRTQEIEGGDEGLFSGQIRIISHGAVPKLPSKDRRRPMAAMGFVGGLGGTLALFFLLGVVDQRAYGIRQLGNRTRSPRCLGVIPEVRGGRAGPDSRDTITQCVHQVRNQIEAIRDLDESLVLAVTSPYPGDGKTTLAMALAWSYTTSGHRAVIVDCDFAGRGVTRQSGLLEVEGVRETLQRRHLDPANIKTLMPNLSVLPCGMDKSFGAESIRRDDFASLCQELKLAFDVIIVDTGPLAGSVELLPVMSAVTGAALVLRRGRSRSYMETALRALDLTQTPIFGVVLNRATRNDSDRYVSSSRSTDEPPRRSLLRNGRTAANGRGDVIMQSMQAGFYDTDRDGEGAST